MRKFIVNVNGTSYEIEVEETTGKQASVSSNNVSVQQPMPASEPEPTGNREIKHASGNVLECPMPGTIMEIRVKAGDNIKRGDVLFVLEAMKMENEIVAPQDGIITDIFVSEGKTVDSGEGLCAIA